MILSDTKILEEIECSRITITPFSIDMLGTNSYDMTLMLKLKIYTDDVIDPHKDNKFEVINIPESGYILEPNKVYIASTNESTCTPYHVPILYGRSSIGRLGISPHPSCGFGDAGFQGRWTLEIIVAQKVKVYPDMKICQVAFHTIDGEIKTSYDKKVNSKYNNQYQPTTSKYYLDNLK